MDTSTMAATRAAGHTRPMLRRSLVAVTVTVAASLFLAGGAAASRGATPEEQADIGASLGIEPTCLTAVVSTAQDGWAKVKVTNAAGCPQGDGVGIVLSGMNGWSLIYQGADVHRVRVRTSPTSRWPWPPTSARAARPAARRRAAASTSRGGRG